MYAEARRVTNRDESFCLDVVQDAMVRVIRSMKPMDAEHRLRGWLKVVVQTCACDRLRREVRMQRRERLVSRKSRPSTHCDETVQRMEWIQNELSNLDDPHVRLIVLRYRLGWTLQRIGRAMGLKPGAVDGRIHRAIAVLRRRAEKVFDD